ncbi:MAG: SDR family NAD(P)-dependent oxidoreductase [Myxococcota bacterium]
MSELLSLAGRAAIVTGGAKGIGRAIALRLAEAGAKVLITDVDETSAASVAAEINASGGTASSLRADEAILADGRGSVDACVERYGRVDVLVNNAGIFPARAALELTEEGWDRVFAVNLRGAFFTAQAAARRMIDANHGGVIVNIASIDAIHPTGSLVHYDASKAGMVMMTRSLALELGRHGIRVVAVAPGSVDTPGAAAAGAAIVAGLGLSPEALMKGFLARVPLGRSGTPDEIATTVAFLASDAAAYVTGAALVVDGGYLVA